MAAPTRWGVAGAGAISADFVTSLKALPAGHHRVVAVAARSLDSAKKFADKYGAEKAYGSYAELAQDPDVDVVYVGVVQSKHLEVASVMLGGGKHLLCEKPLCMNVRQTRQLLDLAKQHKLFLMEAVWSRYFPAYKELQRRLAAGEIGEVVQVIASFGENCTRVDRRQKKDSGGGVAIDIAFYLIQLTTLVMGGERPLKVLAGGHLNAHNGGVQEKRALIQLAQHCRATRTHVGLAGATTVQSLRNPEGVDETIAASLVYSKGRVASIAASMKVELPSEAFIVGTKGTIKLPFPMWCPESLEGPSGTFREPLPKGETFNYTNSQGLMYEAAEVRRCLHEGLLESPGMTHEETLIIAEVMEAVRTQLRTVYPEDDA